MVTLDEVADRFRVAAQTRETRRAAHTRTTVHEQYISSAMGRMIPDEKTPLKQGFPPIGETGHYSRSCGPDRGPCAFACAVYAESARTTRSGLTLPVDS